MVAMASYPLRLARDVEALTICAPSGGCLHRETAPALCPGLVGHATPHLNRHNSLTRVTTLVCPPRAADVLGRIRPPQFFAARIGKVSQRIHRIVIQDFR